MICIYQFYNKFCSYCNSVLAASLSLRGSFGLTCMFKAGIRISLKGLFPTPNQSGQRHCQARTKTSEPMEKVQKKDEKSQ